MSEVSDNGPAIPAPLMEALLREESSSSQSRFRGPVADSLVVRGDGFSVTAMAHILSTSKLGDQFRTSPHCH